MKIKGFQDTINWYNKNADSYAKSIQNKAPVGLDEFVKALPVNSKVLDAGCAAGRDTKWVHDHGKEVVGIDKSQELIKIARKNNPEIKFIEGDFLHLPFNEQFFGGVLSLASLLHFETVKDVINALKEFNRVLMKEGALLIKVKEKLTEKKFEIISDKLSRHDRFFQYFEEEELKKYLKETGFKVIKVDRIMSQSRRNNVKWLLILAKKQR